MFLAAPRLYGFRMASHRELTNLLEADRQEEFPADALFAAASSAVILADGASHRIVAANPAALALLDARLTDLRGFDWCEAFADSCEEALSAAAEQAATSRGATEVRADGRINAARLSVMISCFYSSKHPYLLIRLTSEYPLVAPAEPPHSAVLDHIDALPTGFVLADGELRIEFWNRAFTALIGDQTRGEIEGQSLLRWIHLTPADLDRMREQMAQREATISMTTTVSASHAFAMTVEVIAVSAPDATCAHWAFILRKVEPQSPPPRGQRLQS